MAITYIRVWWESLLRPDHAARVVLSGEAPPKFFGLLTVAVCGMYAVYGASMGLFQGPLPGLASALKVPLLYAATLAVCFPAFYVANCCVGPRLPLRSCVRLLLLALSANAVALFSYSPVSYFFTFTTSDDGYAFIVFMHVVVFALSAFASLAVVTALFRASAIATNRRIRPITVWLWGILYGAVGGEMAWLLRPWIGWGKIAYTFLRPVRESFLEAFLRLIRLVL